jgi:hypothetical protein
MSDESNEQEVSGEDPKDETGADLVLRGLRQLVAGDVSGTIGRLTLILVAITASMEVLRQFGLDDKTYPFFTQQQGQALQALVEDDHAMLCDLVTRSGGEPPSSCKTTE